MYTALVQQYQGYGDNKEDNFKTNISNVLAYLAREEYAKNEGFGKDVRSAITLTPSQKETLGKFVDLGEKFKSGDSDFLAEGREKAYKASKYTRKTDPSETSEKILSYVKDNPGATNSKLQTYLQESGQRIGMTRVSEFTSALRNEGKLIGDKKKTQFYYSVPEEPQPSTEET